MSVKLIATWELPTVLVVLPNPLFGDFENSVNEVELARSMNNTVRTFIKSKDGRKILNFRFQLTRAKALEVYYFYRAHMGDQIKIEDHKGRTWRGYFAVNPIDLESARSLRNNPSELGDNLTQVTLEFEAYLQ